jgi:hypothetical protein
MHHTVALPLTFLVVGLLTSLCVQSVSAQRLVFGGGISAGSLPRALEPLCASARRLGGPGLSGHAALITGRVRLGVTVDHVARVGVRDAAECVPHSGISVDSLFARAGQSATSLAVNAWVPLGGVVRVGAEAGRVLNHSSWFMGPALGAQYGRIHLEVIARRHSTGFDEITRDYGQSSVREISRISRSEGSWGAVARLLITT